MTGRTRAQRPDLPTRPKDGNLPPSLAMAHNRRPSSVITERTLPNFRKSDRSHRLTWTSLGLSFKAPADTCQGCGHYHAHPGLLQASAQKLRAGILVEIAR